MAPVTEFACLTPREGQETEFEAALASTASTLLQQPGVKAVHSSATLEPDNPLHLMVIDWDSVDAHHAFTASAAIGPFAETLRPVVAGPPHTYNIAFTPEHPAVLHNGKGAKTAVAELLHLYFPAGDAFTADQLAATAKNCQVFLDSLPGNAAGTSGETAAGWALEELEFKGEKVRAFVVPIGWDSLEAHQKYRETDHFANNIKLIRGLEGLKGVEVFHVSTKTW